jgi:hypothetical protein
MRIATIILPLVLAAAPAFAAGGGGDSSSSGKPANRYQAGWHLAVPLGSTTGETEVVLDGRHGLLPEDGHDAPAEHAEAESGDHPPAGGNGAPDEASDRLVDMPIIVAPLVVDGELKNYAFVTMQLDIAPGHDPWRVRSQAAYLRDAMLRAAHEQPVNPPHDSGSIDPEIATRVWTAAAERVLGDGVVGGLHIVGADIRYPELTGGR